MPFCILPSKNIPEASFPLFFDVYNIAIKSSALKLPWRPTIEHMI